MPLLPREDDDSPYYTPSVYYTPTPTFHRALETSSSTSTSQQHGPTGVHGPDSSDDDSPWDHMAAGPKSAIIFITCLIFLAVIIASIWFCCGCCGLRQRRREARNLAARGKNPRHLELGDLQETERRAGVPMATAPNAGQPFVVGANVGLRGGQGSAASSPTITTASVNTHTDTDAAPPSYDSVVPVERRMNLHPSHSHGISPVSSRSEEEGVISDGKTPLSELSLQDVVLDTSMNAGGSSRDFQSRHHGARVGDTTGHTNS